MRAAVFRVMALTLLRDRAALAMSFVLPGLVFVIFANIFAGASGGVLNLRVAIADLRGDATSHRLIEQLLADQRLTRVAPSARSAPEIDEVVRRAEADVGLVVRADGSPLDDLGAEGAAPLVIIGDGGREIAITMLAGALQKAYFAALPDAAVRSIGDLIDRRIAPFSAEQKARLKMGLEAMRAGDGSGEPQGLRLDKLYERRDAVAAGTVAPAVIYYAGGVAMLFLLFSALTGAMSLLEERESGLLDRLASSPGGVGVLLDGKFLFLVLQGFCQVLLIYLVAWSAFGVALLEHAGPWAATTLAAAIAAAGLAMGFVTLCRSKQQAQTLGQMLILVVSAIGGSMVPRYLMPPQVQALGWATPNTWALEAYASIFARGDPIGRMILPWSMLVGVGLAGLFVAHIVARRTV